MLSSLIRGTFLSFALLAQCVARTDPEDVTRARAADLVMVLEEFLAQRDSLPTSLPLLCEAIPGCNRQSTVLTHDGWGSPLHYERMGRDFRLTSAGHDYVLGTPDDIPFDPSTRQRFGKVVTGCWELAPAALGASRVRLELAAAHGELLALTERLSVHGMWTPWREDSIIVTLLDGRSIVEARLAARQDTLRGAMTTFRRHRSDTSHSVLAVRCRE